MRHNGLLNRFNSLWGCSVIILGLFCLGCGIRGYHWASYGPGDTSAGDITHAMEPGARVVVPNTLPDPPAEDTGGCDKAIWAHVYHPNRLKVIQQCMTVTGVIVDATHGKRKDGQRHEADSDNHGWLKLDPDFQSLLISGNNAAEDGNMVFECVCQYGTPKQADAKPACKGFKSSVKIPPVGSHVAITGSLVEDEDHQPIHREIHPVTKILVQ